ncbi:UNKNOWN [Stylonychia lemnae]|uniref:Uncharacterized protein n=1 Tax=Stylonychia lemnae TaxID=5949 RepID=A0A078A646_STYLE|nr:UNKNOWN [Stylonychia lemnae]|eukprot:CDW77720.1 UNKNOWN [Stylonychia lemnae]
MYKQRTQIQPRVRSDDFSYISILSSLSETDQDKNVQHKAFPLNDYTPQQFIQDTSVEIDISQSYFEVKKQYQRYNVGLILLQLNHQKIQECYKGKFLLQIWRNKVKVFQKSLQFEIKSWNIDHHFPIYIAQIKYHPNEDGSDKISLFQIYKNDTVEELRIHDFAQFPQFEIMSCSKNYCIQASQNMLRVVELLFQYEEYEEVKTMEIQPKGLKFEEEIDYEEDRDMASQQTTDSCSKNIFKMIGFKRIVSIFYDQTDHFNLIIECSDNTLLIEKIVISEKRIILKNSYNDRLYDFCNDPVRDICFDYEYNTILSIKKSGTIEIFKNSVLIYNRKDRSNFRFKYLKNKFKGLAEHQIEVYMRFTICLLA